MQSSTPSRRAAVRLGLAGLLLAAAATAPANDPRDEAYYRTFYVTPIGAWGAETPVADEDNPDGAGYPQGVGNVDEYKTSMLQGTGGVQPRNIKAGISDTINWLLITHGGYFDYVYNPQFNLFDLNPRLEQALIHDVPIGFHMNGTPWADDPNQSTDILHNYLEIYNGGEYLSRNRNGEFRRGVQDPTINEDYSEFSPQLEMQLTLSPYATGLRDYMRRNLRQSARIYHWYYEQHPDLIVYNSASSEYAQNALDNEWFDYSTWTVAEYRDWLRGAGLYDGSPRYADLGSLNSDHGTSFATWEDVVPSTTPTWNTSTAAGRRWTTWQEFRIHQVAAMVQSHQDWVISTGWNPDRTYGHQIPWTPGSTNNTHRRYATPWTTTFTHSSSNGITTYGTMAASNAIFSAVAANDKNWGIFEYNRLSTDQSTNLDAIYATWNNGIHILTPYAWGGQETYRIQGGSAFELALRQFFTERQNDRFSALEYWEAHPDSRNAVWTMSYPSHVESVSGAAGGFGTGEVAGAWAGTVSTGPAVLELELDATTPLQSELYDTASFRLRIDDPSAAPGALVWTAGGTDYSIPFDGVAGWHRYEVRLNGSADWLDQAVTGLALRVPAADGTDFELDWVQLHHAFAWSFDDPGEVSLVADFTGDAVAGGAFTGTSGPDGHLYLSSDAPAAGIDADRLFINAATHNLLRVRMTTDTPGSLQFYFWRRGDTTPYFSDVAVSPGTATYEVDLSANPDWNGQITQFRIDPVNAAGANVSVDYVQVTRPLNAPRPAYVEAIALSSTPRFDWDPAIDPSSTGEVYDFQLASDFDFASIVIDETDLAQAFHTATSPVPMGHYWWRVRARSAGGAASPWSFPMPVLVRPWTFDDEKVLFITNDLGAPTITGGVLSMESTGGDPHFYFNVGDSSGSRIIAAERYNSFRARLRITGTTGQVPVQFFFFPTGGTPPFGSVSTTINAGDWVDLEIDLAGHADWKGDMNLVRLDPGAQAGLTIELEGAELSTLSADPFVPDWTFDTPGDTEGWVLANAATLIEVADGALKFNVTGNDPNVNSAAFNVPASTYRYILLDILNTTNNGAAEIFFMRDGGGVTPTQSQQFTITAGDSAFQRYVLDMTGVPNYGGDLTMLRLDPIAGWSSGPQRIEIDRIAVLEDYPLLGPAWDFTRANDYQGWDVPGANDIANVAVSGGRMTFDITGGDPFIVSPPVDVDSATYRWVRFVVENDTSATGGQLYWAVDGGGITGTQAVTFPLSPARATSQEVVLDLGAHPEWTGQITQVRFDPVDSQPASGTSYAIESFEILDTDPNPARTRDWRDFE